jgi:hypothetical protein
MFGSKICLLLAFMLIALFAISDAAPKYSSQEKAALAKFREMVKDVTYKEYMKSDPYLIRWLRARDFDLKEADTMLREAIQWRKQNKIDSIVKESIMEFQAPPAWMDGIDREGSLIFVLLPARIDIRKQLLAGKREDVIRYFHQLLEKREIKTLTLLGLIGNGTDDKPAADRVTAIVDLQGYNLRQHGCLTCLTVYGEWLRDLEKYYPSYGKHFIMINAGRIAVPMIELLKPIMSPSTRKIFQVFGANQKEWGPVLNKIISPEQVPANLGGTRKEY